MEIMYMLVGIQQDLNKLRKLHWCSNLCCFIGNVHRHSLWRHSNSQKALQIFENVFCNKRKNQYPATL